MRQGGLRTRLEIAFGVVLLVLVGVFLNRTFSSPFLAQVVTDSGDQVSEVRLPKIETIPEPPTPPTSPAPAPSAPPESTYPLHSDITATYFWVGEGASDENGFISNAASAWDVDWAEHFGGTDDPDNRNGYFPAGFTPKENPFYFALPYSEYKGHSTKENATQIYWYKPFDRGTSILKNRWIKITRNGKSAYAQWQDVGPYETDDIGYVFGTDDPQEDVGLDVSPAVRDYLEMGGKSTVSWQFIDQEDVPSGPWKEIVTTSGITW